MEFERASDRMARFNVTNLAGPLDLRVLYREMADYLASRGFEGDKLMFGYHVSHGVEVLEIRWALHGVLANGRSIKLCHEHPDPLSRAFNDRDPVFARQMKRNLFMHVERYVETYEAMAAKGWVICGVCGGELRGEICPACDSHQGTYPKDRRKTA